MAEIVVSHQIEEEDPALVHVNYILVKANDPDQAYRKALELGEEHSSSDSTNSEGRRLIIRFRGLRDLNVIHERLEDGAEIRFEAYEGPDKADIEDMVRSKEQLSVFRQRQR